MLTLDDVLTLEWPDAPAWGPTGTYLAATVYQDDGKLLLIDRPDDETAWRIDPADEHVTDFAWSPTDPVLVCTTDQGRTALVDPRERRMTTLTQTPDGDADHAWSPDGNHLAFYRDGRPWIRSLEDGTERGFDVPERGPFLGESRMLAWSDDDLLAYRFAERDAKCVGVVDTDTGDLCWQSRPDVSSSNPLWLGDGRLCLERRSEYGAVLEYVAVDVHEGTETVLYREEDHETGALSRCTPQLSPDRSNLAATLSIDGYEHVSVIDVETGERTQLTDGAFEDKGLADSSPRWLDDEHLVFASNRRDSGQRHLFVVDLEGAVTPLVTTAGTNVEPRPSPDGSQVAYLHASVERSTEIRVRACRELLETPASDRPGEPADGLAGDPRRRTRSSVADWPMEPIEPERVTFESDEVRIDGYLLDPRRGESVADDATDLPSVVYVHGGPMRQMRDGFHPGRAYGLAYAVQQYLAAKGYVGLLVNYRGGIGYGRAFRGAIGGNRGRVEMTDIARAADYLRDLEYTSDAVGQWGLSYGGYAALQLPGTHPDAFDVTVNLAGVADLEAYHEWATDTKFPAIATSAITVMGHPRENAERWADASPITHMDRYETPLYNFHGSADRSVNVGQLDAVVDRLLDLEVPFEAEYYPEEAHVFERRATWERTLEKLEAAFERHLADG